MRLVLAFLALLTLLAPPAVADPRPFELREGQVVINVTIKGKQLPALLDTGATQSLIETDLARELGIRVQKFNGGTVGAGGARVNYGMTDRKVTIDIGAGPESRRIGTYEAGHAFAADGVRLLIGMDLLDDLAVTLDFQQMTIDLHSPSEFVPPQGAHFKLTDAGWLRGTLVVGLAGAQANLLLDTAASSAIHLDSDFVDLSPVLKALPVSSRQISGFSGVREVDAIIVPHVTLGGLAFENVRATSGPLAGIEHGSTDIDGVVGVALLKRFQVVIDYARNRVWMTPNDSATEPTRTVATP